MNAADLAQLNGCLSAEMKRRKTAGETGSDEAITNRILADIGLEEIKIGRQLLRLRRWNAAAQAPSVKANAAP